MSTETPNNQEDINPSMFGSRFEVSSHAPVDFMALSQRVLDERREAQATWSPRQVTDELADYLARIAAMDRSEDAVAGVIVGLGLRRDLAIACAARPDTSLEQAEALLVINHLLEETQSALATVGTLNDSGTQDRLVVLEQELNYSFRAAAE